MTLADAKKLIAKFKITGTAPQRWADLGCGSGLFSMAIASMLPNESDMLCIDLIDQKVPSLSGRDVTLQFKKGNFIDFDLGLDQYDGILMANSLHFVSEKSALFIKLCSALKKQGSLVIIEYEREDPNEWVPYPVAFETLRVLLNHHGMAKVTKLSERKSAFGSMMYACQASVS